MSESRGDGSLQALLENLTGALDACGKARCALCPRAAHSVRHKASTRFAYHHDAQSMQIDLVADCVTIPLGLRVAGSGKCRRHFSTSPPGPAQIPEAVNNRNCRKRSTPPAFGVYGQGVCVTVTWPQTHQLLHSARLSRPLSTTRALHSPAIKNLETLYTCQVIAVCRRA